MVNVLGSLQVRSANTRTNKSSTVYSTESYVVSLAAKYDLLNQLYLLNKSVLRFLLVEFESVMGHDLLSRGQKHE